MKLRTLLDASRISLIGWLQGVTDMYGGKETFNIRPSKLIINR